jgi:ammonium transporter Rh
LFSLIGTLFLWIYWPSFNGGYLEPNSEQQERAIVNTIFSLCASTVATFWTSIILSHDWKIRPVDVQNATLAGGVALGAVCHFTLNISDALLIGAAAGAASTFGFSRLQAILDDNGLHDTCGVNNLHGIPSLIGGFASVILAGAKATQGHDVPDVMTHKDQWIDQIVSIAFTLSVAISSGIATGWFLKFYSYETTFYSDEPFWEVMDDFGRGQEHEDVNEDLEAGLEASRLLRQLIEEYGLLGGSGGMLVGTNSKAETKAN